MVDQYFKELIHWKLELKKLRELLLETELKEELKWKTPCYTYEGKNVIIVASLKNYCGLSFFKGALLKDKQNLLEKPGKNSQAVRMFQFQGIKEIKAVESSIKEYIQEAIEIEKVGLTVEKPKNLNNDYCPELAETLMNDVALRKSFEALTPGRRRGYNIFISGSKKSSIRLARIEKNRQRIMDGYGIHDCTCGLSKRLPNCDGSHKKLA